MAWRHKPRCVPNPIRLRAAINCTIADWFFLAGSCGISILSDPVKYTVNGDGKWVRERCVSRVCRVRRLLSTLTGTSRNTSGCKSCNGFPLRSRYLRRVSMKKLRCTSSTIELSAKLRRRRSCVERVMPIAKVYYGTCQINNVSFDQHREREREREDTWAREGSNGIHG